MVVRASGVIPLWPDIERVVTRPRLLHNPSDAMRPVEAPGALREERMRMLNAPDRRQILLSGLAIALAPRSGWAEDARPTKIGIMNDMSSVYSDYQGIGSVVAAQLAVDDFSAKMGVPIEIVYADHQNKSDVGSTIARRWIDEDHVDVIMDLPNSAVALAVLAVCEEKNKAVIGSGAGSSVQTGPKCSRNFVHWTYDTYAWGAGLGKALTEAGGKKWFFITADYAFGKDIEAQLRRRC